VPKGGSACNVWYEGFGENGYLQTSSATVYTRTEDMHMPIETSPVPLPLTPRIETTIQGVYYTNLFETLGTMSVSQASDNVSVTTTGKLVSQSGTNSASSFSLTNRFYDSMVKKEITVSGATASFSIIEPFVKDKGTAFAKSGSNSVTIKPANGLAWTLHVDSATTVPFTITLGTDSARYWCPFPGIEAYPVIVSFATTGTGPQTIVLTINGPQPTDIRSRSACIAKQELLALQSRPTPSGDIGIRYCLPAEGHAFLAVYSLSGKLVAVLCKGEASGGTHAFVWNVSGTPRGMYLCTLTWKNRVVSSTVIR
jgi:hypothetical protein